MKVTIGYYRYVIVNPHSGIRWSDGQGNHPVTAKALGIPKGRRALYTAEAVMAHHVDVHAALAVAALAYHAEASARLAAHRDTGASHIGLEKHDLDWGVYLEDREHGSTPTGRARKQPKKRRLHIVEDRSMKRSALSIEFGHKVAGGGSVGGLFVLTGAADHMAKRPRKAW